VRSRKVGKDGAGFPGTLRWLRTMRGEWGGLEAGQGERKGGKGQKGYRDPFILLENTGRGERKEGKGIKTHQVSNDA